MPPGASADIGLLAESSYTMLSLEHLSHLPELDPLIERIVREGPGLIVVAGFDPRGRGRGDGPSPQAAPAEPAEGGFLPSGRTAILRILMREMLALHAGPAAVVAQDKEAFRVPRRYSRRVELVQVLSEGTYAQAISRAMRRAPVLLTLDRLDAETVPAAFEAARVGLRVLSQLDTVLTGGDAARQLVDLGATAEQLANLKWIVYVQRVATLCPHCRRSVAPDPKTLSALYRRYPTLDVTWGTGSDAPQVDGGGLGEGGPQGSAAYRAVGCAHCRHTGRLGQVTCFDVFCAESDPPELFEQPSVLSLGQYALGLAHNGYLSLEDVLDLERERLRRTYGLYVASERAVAEVNAAVRRRVVELEAANRVLQRRTEALISLQDLGQALIGSGLTGEAIELDDLARRICRHVGALCGADRTVLYLIRPGPKADAPSTDEASAEILAVHGWNADLVHQQLDAARAFPSLPRAGAVDAEPQSFNRLPPGVPPEQARGVALGAGLRVPLVAQGERVGWLIAHTTRNRAFAPGEVALLQTYASQAALAIQRAGLIEELRNKIEELEAAQAQLAQKERMERELELARQVQQSVLPRTFPHVPGYAFAAHNEPARRVGGDFYDVIRLDNDRFGVAIADVSDKGMPAALYMALTRSLLLAEARRALSPRTVLQNVNRLLLELGEPGMFVSVFYGVVEASTRRLVYARAGHDLPLLLRGETVLSLGGRGTVLGILDPGELRLSEEGVVLVPGDRLVLYTDGLTDVLAPDGQLYSLDQLKTLLRRCATERVDEFCAATFAGLTAYRGTAEPFDDMTMLVVQVT